MHCPTGWVDPFGLSRTSKIDHIGDVRPVSGHTGFLNSSRLSRRQLTDIGNELEGLGINFVKNADRHFPAYARGGFDYSTGTVYLKRGATRYEAFHEMTHAKQFAEIGKDAYLALGTYARESHVFNTIIGNRKMFSSEELKHAVGYMRELKKRYFRGAIN